MKSLGPLGPTSRCCHDGRGLAPPSRITARVEEVQPNHVLVSGSGFAKNRPTFMMWDPTTCFDARSPAFVDQRSLPRFVNTSDLLSSNSRTPRRHLGGRAPALRCRSTNSHLRRATPIAPRRRAFRGSPPRNPSEVSMRARPARRRPPRFDVTDRDVDPGPGRTPRRIPATHEPCAHHTHGALPNKLDHCAHVMKCSSMSAPCDSRSAAVVQILTCRSATSRTTVGERVPLHTSSAAPWPPIQGTRARSSSRVYAPFAGAG